MPRTRTKYTEEEYLHDGVFVALDAENNVWITDCAWKSRKQKVCLEPETRKALLRYLEEKGLGQ